MGKRACQVDYYMLHAITKENYELHKRLGGFKYIASLKERGLVNKIGISFHDKPQLLDEILSNYPDLDFVVLQINFLDWDDPVICARENYKVARKFNKPIIVMEPIKGGSLAAPINIEGVVISAEEMAGLSLRFVSELQGIETILSGMSEIEHVRQNRESIKSKTGDRQYGDLYGKIKEYIKTQGKIPCTACGYCIRECPKNIMIPNIISVMNTYKDVYKTNVVGGAMSVYQGEVYGKGKASDCIQCGRCERRCPQKLPIKKHMLEAKKMFEIKVVTKRENVSDTKLHCNIGNKTVVLWGAGRSFRKNLMDILQFHNIEWVCDNNSDLWGKEVFPGITCISPRQACQMNNVYIIVMIEDEKVYEIICEQLNELKLKDYCWIYNWLESAKKEEL